MMSALLQAPFCLFCGQPSQGSREVPRAAGISERAFSEPTPPIFITIALGQASAIPFLDSPLALQSSFPPHPMCMDPSLCPKGHLRASRSWYLTGFEFQLREQVTHEFLHPPMGISVTESRSIARLECSDAIPAHCNFRFPVSNSPASASRVAGLQAAPPSG
ncbi:hypothetical protein AAY473_024969 [Plecturocebus cupreus]